MATITLELDTAQVMGALLRGPGGLELDGTVEGCPCSLGGQATPLRADAEGVSCRCGRPIARWTGAPGVSGLAMVDSAPA